MIKLMDLLLSHCQVLCISHKLMFKVDFHINHNLLIFNYYYWQEYEHSCKESLMQAKLS